MRGALEYFAVNEIAGKRRIKANVSRIRAVFCECDDGLPKGGFPIEPTMMVETSPGKFHVYWACDGLSVEDFNRVMERMVADYGSDDGAKDITRILRLAGSWRMKDPEAPWQVRIIAETDKRYTRSEIMAAFPPIERKQRDTDKQVRALKAGTAHIGAELERIDGALRAIPPNVKYATWLTIGMALHDYLEATKPGWRGGTCGPKAVRTTGTRETTTRPTSGRRSGHSAASGRVSARYSASLRSTAGKTRTTSTQSRKSSCPKTRRT